VLLLVIAFIYVNNMTLMLAPERWSVYFERPGGRSLNLGEPTLWPRYLHMVIGALAVAGLGRALRAAWLRRRGGGSGAGGERALVSGLRLFWVATALQVGVGVWFLASLPRPIMMRFMGDSSLLTAALFLALGLAFAAIVAAVRGRLYGAAVLAAALLALMVLVRDGVRAAYLEGVVALDELPLDPEPGPLWIFLGALLVGVVVLVWLLRVVLAGSRREVAR